MEGRGRGRKRRRKKTSMEGMDGWRALLFFHLHLRGALCSLSRPLASYPPLPGPSRQRTLGLVPAIAPAQRRRERSRRPHAHRISPSTPFFSRSRRSPTEISINESINQSLSLINFHRPGFPVPAFLKSGVTDAQVRTAADAAAVYVNKALGEWWFFFDAREKKQFSRRKMISRPLGPPSHLLFSFLPPPLITTLHPQLQNQPSPTASSPEKTSSSPDRPPWPCSPSARSPPGSPRSASSSSRPCSPSRFPKSTSCARARSMA